MRPQRLEPDLFDRLAQASGETLISIYLPTHVKGAEVRQDPIRLKNGVAEVDADLEAAGWSPKHRAARLDPIRLLIEDEEFCQHQGPGLGVLVDDEADVTTVALSSGCGEQTLVSNVFHLRPAVASLHPVELPVLVLTKGAVRLYRVSRHQASPIDVDLPESFDDVNWFVDREPQRQRHPDLVGTDRGRHGHAGGYRDEDLDRFLRAVADALPDPNRTQPLIVLGDDNLAARFAKVSEHQTISPPHSGVEDVDDHLELQRRAAEVIESREEALLADRLGEAKEHLASGDAITDLEQALAATVSGRIDVLLLDADAEPMWGSFDPDTLEMAHHEERAPYVVDLLDRLAVHAVGTGADVMVTGGPVEGHHFVAVPRF